MFSMLCGRGRIALATRARNLARSGPTQKTVRVAIDDHIHLSPTCTLLANKMISFNLPNRVRSLVPSRASTSVLAEHRVCFPPPLRPAHDYRLQRQRRVFREIVAEEGRTHSADLWPQRAPPWFCGRCRRRSHWPLGPDAAQRKPIRASDSTRPKLATTSGCRCGLLLLCPSFAAHSCFMQQPLPRSQRRCLRSLHNPCPSLCATNMWTTWREGLWPLGCLSSAYRTHRGGRRTVDCFVWQRACGDKALTPAPTSPRVQRTHNPPRDLTPAVAGLASLLRTPPPMSWQLHTGD